MFPKGQVYDQARHDSTPTGQPWCPRSRSWWYEGLSITLYKINQDYRKSYIMYIHLQVFFCLMLRYKLFLFEHTIFCMKNILMNWRGLRVTHLPETDHSRVQVRNPKFDGKFIFRGDKGDTSTLEVSRNRNEGEERMLPIPGLKWIMRHDKLGATVNLRVYWFENHTYLYQTLGIRSKYV